MALTLAVLGMPDEAIVDDYALSEAAYKELADRNAMVGALAQVSWCISITPWYTYTCCGLCTMRVTLGVLHCLVCFVLGVVVCVCIFGFFLTEGRREPHMYS